jgi:hypothetical protein
MSTFEKYLKIISESNGYLNAPDTTKEIAVNNSREIVYSSNDTFTKVELDDEAKEFIENIVDHYEGTMKNNPNLTVYGTISRFTLPTLNPKMKKKFVTAEVRRLGKNIKPEDYDNFKKTLMHELIDKLNKSKYNQYFGDGSIKIINDETSNKGNSAYQTYPWFAIDIDVKDMKQRPGNAPVYSVKRSYPNVDSSEKTQKFINAATQAIQGQQAIDTKKRKEKSKEIEEKEKKKYSGPGKKNKK